MFHVIVTPPLIENHEWRYACRDEQHLRRVSAAFKTLGIEVVDVLRGDESLEQEEYQKILSG